LCIHVSGVYMFLCIHVSGVYMFLCIHVFGVYMFFAYLRMLVRSFLQVVIPH